MSKAKVDKNTEIGKWYVALSGNNYIRHDMTVYGHMTGDGGTYFDTMVEAVDLMDRYNAAQASDTPTTWGDMTDAEQMPIVFADHKRRAIEFANEMTQWEWKACLDSIWYNNTAYRIKPEPTRETVTLTGWERAFGPLPASMDTHMITFDKIDGVIDCASVKMEALE